MTVPSSSVAPAPGLDALTAATRTSQAIIDPRSTHRETGPRPPKACSGAEYTTGGVS